MESSSVNTDLLRSRVDTFVLGSLAEKDGYGYDILNYIYAKTNGHYEMKQSSIYSVLKRLEKQGLVVSYIGDESNGGKRRYYSLTDKGREFLIEEQKEWSYTRTLLDNLVTDSDFDLVNDTPPFKASDLRPLTKRSRSDEDEAAETEDEYEQPKKAEPEINMAKSNDSSAIKAETQCENEPKPSAQAENQYFAAAAVYPEDDPIDFTPTTEPTKEKPGLFSSATPEVKVSNNSSKTMEERLESTRKSFFEKYEELKEIQSASAPAGLFSGKTEAAPASAFSRKHLSDTIFGPKQGSAELDIISSEQGQDINYKAIFSEIYSEKQKKQPLEVSQDDDEYRHINDLKTKLLNEGFTLKSYSKTESLKAMEKTKYLYANRILRDTSIFSFLFVVLMLLVLYRFNNVFGYSPIALLVIGICALVFPVVAISMSLTKPNKKVRPKFNFRLSLTYSLIALVAVYLINLVISLLIPSIGLTVKDAKLYPPSMLALVFPFTVTVYYILYKTERYFLSA